MIWLPRWLSKSECNPEFSRFLAPLYVRDELPHTNHDMYARLQLVLSEFERDCLTSAALDRWEPSRVVPSVQRFACSLRANAACPPCHVPPSLWETACAGRRYSRLGVAPIDSAALSYQGLDLKFTCRLTVLCLALLSFLDSAAHFLRLLTRSTRTATSPKAALVIAAL